MSGRKNEFNPLFTMNTVQKILRFTFKAVTELGIRPKSFLMKMKNNTKL